MANEVYGLDLDLKPDAAALDSEALTDLRAANSSLDNRKWPGIGLLQQRGLDFWWLDRWVC